MKKTLAPEVEACRADKDGGTKGDGCYGAFALTHPETGRTLVCIVSDGRDWGECGLEGLVWEHLSVIAQFGTPTWAELTWCASQFFEDEECLVQFRPAKSQYVNANPHALHLWRPRGYAIPMPPKECV